MLQAPASQTMTRRLLVVARDEPGIYDSLRRRYANIPSVRVIVDRRFEDRRRHRLRTDVERRHVQRRQQWIDDRLHSLGYAIISLP